MCYGYYLALRSLLCHSLFLIKKSNERGKSGVSGYSERYTAESDSSHGDAG